MIKFNYHTHSTFCDGHDTLEDMIKSAIEKKVEILGFSGHSMYPFSSDWHIPVNDFHDYINSVRTLADRYRNDIKIYAGFEADYIYGITGPDFERYVKFTPDYIIGSVHFVTGNGGYFEADGSPVDVLGGIRNAFGGDEKKAVKRYFELEREMLDSCNFTFLAHPDLIRKQNAKRTLFDENALWYRRELKETAKAIQKSGVCVEVNTGGILRCGMMEPYPSPYFLSLLKERNVPVTISSDAHSVDGVDFYFYEAIEYIRKAGYSEVAYFDDGILKFQSI